MKKTLQILIALLACASMNAKAQVWSALGTGVSSANLYTHVYAVTSYNTDLFAGGDLTTAGGNAANHVAKWNGTNWSALGTGINGTAVLALTAYSGSLYAGGIFSMAGGVSASNIAKWNGAIWSSLVRSVSKVKFNF